ncbi:MAG: hypothetical protein AAF806_13950, partial [Bacteroidota bacterium]
PNPLSVNKYGINQILEETNDFDTLAQKLKKQYITSLGLNSVLLGEKAKKEGKEDEFVNAYNKALDYLSLDSLNNKEFIQSVLFDLRLGLRESINLRMLSDSSLDIIREIQSKFNVDLFSEDFDEINPN